MTFLSSLFAPKSLAVIGASRRGGTLGKMFLDALVGMNYKGTIYPINPKADQLNGIKCYPEIACIPEIPDLAIILLPKEKVYSSVEAIVQKKIKNIVVVSAGFKELDEAGKKRENDLVNLVRKNGIRMIGPNSMGLFNTIPELSLNATFSPTAPIPGHIGFISQSGALGVAVLELSQKRGLGFSVFTSTGNKADIGDVECLRFLSEDENTKVVILYQESIDNPVSLRNICRELIPRKPVLTLKAGRTAEGLKAVSSHTGVLASDDKVTDAFLQQCGIIRCDTLQELLDSATVLSSQPLPTGNKVAIVTNAGGPGILISDALKKNGLMPAALSNRTLSGLAEILPEEAALNNPIDMIASATHETYKAVCSILVRDPEVHSMIVIVVNPPVNTTPRRIISEMKSLIDHSAKPFIFIVMAAESADRGLDVFKKANVPVFSFPESTVQALGNMVRYVQIRSRFEHLSEEIKESVINPAPIVGRKRQVPIEQILAMLRNYRLKVCEFAPVPQLDQALDFHKKVGKIALKIANEEIIHKSDKGLVKLNLSSPKEIEDAFEEIKLKVKPLLQESNKPFMLAQEMVTDGIEFVLGAKRDPLFGLVIMFGIGGVFIELFEDVTFGVAPIDIPTIEQMVNNLKSRKILEGFRNYAPVNKKVLMNTILRFSNLVMEHPEIVEIDLNPVIWSFDKEHPIIVDSRCTIISKE